MDHRIAVLVVEDEAFIRMAIVDELENAGFDVFEAAHADAAIASLVANLNIRLMFTDIDMPGGMDGLKLAAAVRDRWPPIKIIVTPATRQSTRALCRSKVYSCANRTIRNASSNQSTRWFWAEDCRETGLPSQVEFDARV
jgi:CheY-like chemotaxis protein